VPKLTITFGEIPSRAHGNFELQNGFWSLSSSLSIIILYIIYCVIVTITVIKGEKERAK
jgi:hypothetical protein